MARINIGQAIGLLSFITFLFFIIYDIFQNPYARFVSYAAPVMVFILIFMTSYGDWLPFKRGPLVMTASGLIGTQIGTPVREYGGYETRYVAFQRDQVEDTIKKQVEGNKYWLYDILVGTITIPLRGRVGVDFIPVPDIDLENKHGAVQYLRRIDGSPIKRGLIPALQSQLERQSILINHVFDSMKSLEEQLASITNLKSLDLNAMSQHLQQIADRVKRVTVLTKGTGVNSDVAQTHAEG